MLNRREFLKGLSAMAAAVAVPSLAEAQCGNNINTTLRYIRYQLHQLKLVHRTVLTEVAYPTTGLVQWHWAHFHPAMEDEAIPGVERVNKELFTAMKTLHGIPGTQIDALHHEGMVQGRETTNIAQMQGLHRALVTDQLTVSVPMSFNIYRPKREEVEKEVKDMSHFSEPTPQVVYSPWAPRGRTMNVSPLARLGAGYALAHEKNVPLLPTEDAVLDANAEWAERWAKDEKEYNLHVLEKRNEHFVKTAAKSRSQIQHLLLGFGHDLFPEVVRSNNGVCRGISHLVVTVPGIQELAKNRKADRNPIFDRIF